MHPRIPSPARLARAALSTVLVSGLALVAQSGLSAADAAGGAISTTTNVAAGTGSCLAPVTATDPVNCNTYAAQPDVWLSNLPSALPDGDYFFAVVTPGGEADPNDGAAGLLSTDTHTAREFSVNAGVVTTPVGGHTVLDNRVQLAPFNATTNGGGVYIAVVCAAADYPVAGGDCKYDAFKVGPTTGAEGLVVTKDASGSYDRTYHWTITKSVDRTTVKQVGGSAAFNYAVAVAHDAGTVSDVSVTGTISVFNPNDSAVTGATVTDTLSDNTSCAVTGGADATVEPGSTTFAYTCDLNALPAAELDNTAAVAWPEQTVGADSLAAGSSDFTFADIAFTGTAVDDCVTVNDTSNGALGTRCVGDANEGVPFTYERDIPVVAGCVTYGNTATFTTNESGTTGSADQSVQVCGPIADGARTMGFWMNRNGQGIVSGGAATAGVCNSAAFLRGYVPFKDLSSTATCKQTAAYVAKVEGAATAAGSAMNPMLKAQMLATALDVYFTGPGSTTATRKFLPHSNLGSIAIDLTSICSDAGQCSSFENAGPAFGGASSMTVSQLLTYAASQSNVGGTSWYGQVKATQELAKDTFDAINNEVAFGA